MTNVHTQLITLLAKLTQSYNRVGNTITRKLGQSCKVALCFIHLAWCFIIHILVTMIPKQLNFRLVILSCNPRGHDTWWCHFCNQYLDSFSIEELLMPRIFQKWPFNWNSLSISIKLVSRSTYLILWLIYWNVLKMKLQHSWKWKSLF